MTFRIISFLIIVIYIFGGYAKPPKKIVDGGGSSAGEYPYAVSLQLNETHHCGGCILDNTHILTAAHCIVNNNSELINVDVLVGSTSTTYRTERNVFSVAKMVYHEDYIPGFVLKHDIAILKLEKRIKYSSYQRAIRLPLKDAPENATVMTGGWGRLTTDEEPTEYSNLFMDLEMTIINQQKCEEDFYENIIKSEHICVVSNSTSGICYGDSGSPLVYKDEVIGIASFIKSACAAGNPDVFTRVRSYVQWIKTTIASM